jgi:hypothetical protein
MSQPQPNGLPPERKTVKSRSPNIPSASAAHRASFGDLFEVVQKETGNPDLDRVLYSDPCGWMAGGEIGKNAVHYPTQMFEGTGQGDGWEAVFKRWNSLRPGADTSLFEASMELKKAMDTTSFSLPIFVSPEVYVSSGQNTPLADMMARVAVQEETIEADEQTDVGDVNSFSETGTYTQTDDTYGNHSYDVDAYGREAEVTDFVQLAASSLRSTRSTTEEGVMRAMRQYEEAQVIRGTNNDASGFDGFEDLVSTASPDLSIDLSGATLSIDDIYDVEESLEREGADLQNVVHVTAHSPYYDLKKELDDFTEFTNPGDELDFGFEGIMVDGSPILKSHGVNNTASSRDVWSLDMGGWYMGMLQDATLHPLAKTGPQETFAVDAYGTLVGEGINHLHRIQNVA